MKAPRTKDGKHRLVFDPDSVWTNPLFVRRAVSGRLNYELLRLAKTNPHLVGKMKLEFKGSVQGYDMEKDPLEIFRGITFPVIGSIPLNKTKKIVNNIKMKNHKNEEVVYEDIFFKVPYLVQPYAPFELNRYGFFDGDLINVLYDLEDEKTISRLKRFGIERDKHKETPFLELLLNDEGWRDAMIEWSELSVRYVQGRANAAEESIGLENTFSYHSEQTRYSLPKGVRREMIEAVRGLCHEYLIEMDIKV